MTHLDSLWAKTTSDFPRRPPLQEVIPADVVVIGCGFTGVSAAYHLASSGAQVALLEARTIGFGGSGRNVGLVNAGLWTPPDQVEAKLGPNVGKHLNATLANGPDLVFDLIRRHQILCEATRKGTLHCAHSATGFKDLQNRYRQQQERGAPVDLLNPKETARRTGSPAYFGALWDRRAGTIQPLSYVQGLADAAEKRGARIFEGTSALTITEDQSGWTVRTAEGVVHAAKLIQATNAYGCDASSDNSIVPASYFQMATAPLPITLRRDILATGEGCWDTALIMSSFRLDHAGRMIFGALGNLDGLGGPLHRQWAKRKLARLFPQLAGVNLEQEWTGRIAMTGTYLPRVERRGKEGVSIFGYSGRGIAPGTVFGKCAAEWALGTGSFPVEISAPKTETHATAKSIYYEVGATLAHLTGARL